MLESMDKMKPYVKFDIGDGKTTSVWYDSWSGNDHVAMYISKRDIYDARFSYGSKMADMIRDGGWIWPVCNDSVTHLFFQCPFVDKVWSGMKGGLNMILAPYDWQSIIQMMIRDMCNNSINSVLGRLGIATCVYNIWREINFILFQNVKRIEKDIIKSIKEDIKWKLTILKVKNTAAISNVFKKWNIVV
ncbi:hypothetical protein Tco_1138097 [Tanacetum coccineum]